MPLASERRSVAASGKLHIVLRHVDPAHSRGSLYRAFARFTASRLGFWLSRQIGWRVDPVLLRVTGGRLGTGGFIPTALLDHAPCHCRPSLRAEGRITVELHPVSSLLLGVSTTPASKEARMNNVARNYT
jgi:hypothetical protein